MDREIIRLSDSLILEILNAVGLPKHERLRALIKPIFRKATDHMAFIGVTFDKLVERLDFPSAADWALVNWCKGIIARGAEKIPCTGPLLIVSNHPGTYDSLVITSLLKRNDIRIIAGDIPFLMNLPNACHHFFFVSRNPQNRMLCVRKAIRHLQQEGAILIFGTGQIDPDPAIYSDAANHLERWYPSLNVFLHTVPQTRILLSIVSHTLSPKWAHHPITWLRRKGMEKRRIAEFGQVLQQLFAPGTLYLSPRISFAPPFVMDELQVSQNPLPLLIEKAKTLLHEHIQWTQSLPSSH